MLICKQREESQPRTATPSPESFSERPRAGSVRCQGAPVFWPPRRPSAFARSLVDAPLAYDRG